MFNPIEVYIKLNIFYNFCIILNDLNYKRGVKLEFKYHKSYKGFYLIEGNKFKRPYQKLDQEKTLENLNGKLEFDENRIIKIDSKAVVFIDKNEDKSSKEKITKAKKIQKTVEEIDFESLELKYKIPKLLLKNLYTII